MLGTVVVHTSKNKLFSVFAAGREENDLPVSHSRNSHSVNAGEEGGSFTSAPQQRWGLQVRVRISVEQSAG